VAAVTVVSLRSGQVTVYYSAEGPSLLAPKSTGGSTFIDQEQPKNGTRPRRPTGGPQAGSNPFISYQFTVPPRGLVQYPTSSQ
jgi:hypothetical protein